MNHPAELKLHQFMSDAIDGKTTFSEETAKRIGEEVAEAVIRQFGSGQSRKEFRLRMSNIGRPTCQLWFEKNKPESALPKPSTFVMNMMIGDIVEAIFKGLLKEAKVDFDDTDQVTLDVGDSNGTRVSGSYDLIMGGAVDDIKSASDWSYRNKFESYASLKKSDPFGYIGQLAGYAKASDKRAGGWWVVNKANGDFKYVPAAIDMRKELTKLKETVEKVNENKFERCFEAVPETYRGKPSGNMVLNDNCRFCDYRFECWPNMQELPSKVSQARDPKIVAYVELKE
jgi:hypothetical protein|tara:strand:- start:1030 stop:1884 length:855 start_codon:yes stop_codon:yes gene_type:complete